MTNHIKALGRLYLAFGCLGVGVAIIFINALTGHVAMTGRIGMVSSTSGLVSVIAFVFVMVSIPAIIAGIGLLKRKPWAKILVAIVGFLSLIIIPIGTALGLYTIWVLMNDEAMQQLTGGSD